MPRSSLAVACILVALIGTFHVGALETKIIPLSGRQLRARMTTIFYEREPLTPAIQTRDFLITENDGATKLVSGRDKSGKRWTLLLPSATHGLWEISRGAGRVYYFAGYTGGAGMAPGTWIVVLSFNKQDRPNPFYLNTYNGFDQEGITDLLDLDERGPELLQQDWVETNRAPDTRSGYFITAAYLEQGDYWYRADGRHGSNVFPAFEKWALLPNSGPQRVAASESLAKLTSDYGNDPRAGADARIVGLDDHGIHTEHLDCELQSINVIVNDSQRGREIEVGHFYAGDPGKLLPEVAHRRARIIFTGLRRWPDNRTCDATTAWAHVEER